ncbi:MAG: hypothetical protein HEQ17_00190 [Limnohabitans sp.]|uniref:hypothetical protein n=1 Tax=Limnohabitans sp. TaxID=1907725 RepID=UPI0025F20579|nr:hypothetical protein [Limnohabitans sp.]MCO4087430.1 hypothetical protein [Limnohabitans sp.]
MLLTSVRDVFEAVHTDVLFIDWNFALTVRAKVKVINRLGTLCRAASQAATFKDVSANGDVFWIVISSSFCIHRPRQRLLDKLAREIEGQQAMWVSLHKQRTPSIVSAAARVFIEGQHA